jgi:hypothetical protein
VRVRGCELESKFESSIASEPITHSTSTMPIATLCGSYEWVTGGAGGGGIDPGRLAVFRGGLAAAQRHSADLGGGCVGGARRHFSSGGLESMDADRQAFCRCTARVPDISRRAIEGRSCGDLVCCVSVRSSPGLCVPLACQQPDGQWYRSTNPGLLHGCSRRPRAQGGMRRRPADGPGQA